jgi:hypothetical protein
MATDLMVNTDRRAYLLDSGSETSIADRVIVIGVSLAVVAALGQIVTQVVDFAAFDLRIASLNSDVHMSIFGILSLAAQGAVAVAVAIRCRLSAQRTGWLVLAGLIVVLLAVRAALPDDPIVFLLPVVAAFALFWSLTSGDYHRARAVVRVALFVLAFSFVIHIVGPRIVTALGYGYGSWAYELKGILKHSTELSGWILATTGILAGGLIGNRFTSTRVLPNSG